jgi:cation diffusion facilitator family transporter
VPAARLWYVDTVNVPQSLLPRSSRICWLVAPETKGLVDASGLASSRRLPGYRLFRSPSVRGNGLHLSLPATLEPITMIQDLRQQRASAISRTAVVGGIWNLVLSAIKVAGGVVWHSQSLIADGIHSLSDLLSDILVWFAGRHATQLPDAEHPYGHGRYETIATLALGAFLLAVAVGIAWDAAARLFSPARLLHPEPLSLLAALASIVVKEWLYWWTLGHARRVRSDMLRANAWHHRSDAISSVVVLIGLAGTMAGLPYLDALAAIIVAVMIAKVAWDLGWDAVRELVDTALEATRVAEIKATIRSVGGVRDIHMLRTRRHGGLATADVHVLVDSRVSVSEGHMISLLVEERLKERIDEVTDVTVHIDPEDDQGAPPCAGLPLRGAAIARLKKLWQAEPAATRVQRTVLHYLNGRIDVEIFLPLDVCGGDVQHAEKLTSRLRSAAAADPVFNQVSVYFG